MGKRQQGAKNVAAAAAADKNKTSRKGKGRPDKPPNPDSSGGGVSGPVPVRKVPSWRGNNQLALYAAGAFNKAPSPGVLPQPPSAWMRASKRDSGASLMPPPPVLQAPPMLRRESSVQAELQGNLLYLTLSPQYPELAGKITGMLLELGPDEVKVILGDEARRAAAVREALEVLREAGDERALRAAAPPSAAAAPRAPGGALSVDIGAAQAAQAAEAGISSGLTPSVAGLMRMSPRVSSNPFLTANLLRGSSAGTAVQ